MSSLVRLENKNIFFNFEKRSCLLYNASALAAKSGPNPATVSYNAKSSKVYLENKNDFFYFEKTFKPTMYIQCCLCSCKLGSRRTGSRSRIIGSWIYYFSGFFPYFSPCWRLVALGTTRYYACVCT
jgi:hypothetical protein